MKQFALRFVFLFSALIIAGTPTVVGQDSPKPIAEVNGQPIYEQDLMSTIGPKLLDLRNQEFELKSDALNSVIRKKLIDIEAKKKGYTSEELLKREVDVKIADPSDDEAKGYYLAAKGGTTLPFDQVKSQVKRLLKNAEIERARDEYADSLRNKAQIAFLLQPPAVDVSYDAARVRGNADAPVTIVEFADFQCPYCRKAEATLNQLLTKYDGRVKLAYRDFPLSQIHDHAELAAEASHCALSQGKFWEMHDAMFADGAKLDEPALIKSAGLLGMDQSSFESCLESGKYKATVQRDITAASQAGVEATPAFFINGEFLNGARPEADFAKIIDRKLAGAGATNAVRASR
jgi:protein-disulfide isomerase